MDVKLYFGDKKIIEESDCEKNEAESTLGGNI